MTEEGKLEKLLLSKSSTIETGDDARRPGQAVDHEVLIDPILRNVNGSSERES